MDLRELSDAAAMGIECRFGTLVQPKPTPLAVRFGFCTLRPVGQWGAIYDANRE